MNFNLFQLDFLEQCNTNLHNFSNDQVGDKAHRRINKQGTHA